MYAAKTLTGALCVGLVVTVRVVCVGAFDGQLGGTSVVQEKAAANTATSAKVRTDLNDTSEVLAREADRDKRTQALLRTAQEQFDSSDAQLAKKVAAASSKSLKARLVGRFDEFEPLDQALVRLLLARKQTRSRYLTARSIVLEHYDAKNAAKELTSIAQEQGQLRSEARSLERALLHNGTETQSQLMAAAKDNKSRERIAAALSGQTEPITGGDSLKALLDFIDEVHGFRILPDRISLEAAGIASLEDITVNADLSLSDIRLSSALDIVLQQLDGVDQQLDYIVEHEVLKITTRATALRYLEDRVYRLALASDDPSPAELLQVLTPMIKTDVTKQLSLGVSISLLGNKLIVRHNQRGHRNFIGLLSKLDVGLATHATENASLNQSEPLRRQ